MVLEKFPQIKMTVRSTSLEVSHHIIPCNRTSDVYLTDMDVEQPPLHEIDTCKSDSFKLMGVCDSVSSNLLEDSEVLSLHSITQKQVVQQPWSKLYPQLL